MIETEPLFVRQHYPLTGIWRYYEVAYMLLRREVDYAQYVDPTNPQSANLTLLYGGWCKLRSGGNIQVWTIRN